MKRKILYSLFIVIMSLPVCVKAQTSGTPLIYKDWETLMESNTQLDVSYRVIKCTSVKQVHLMILNENIVDQTANFMLEITNNNDGTKFSKEIIFETKKVTLYKAECDSDNSLDKLKIDLPETYDPQNLTVKVTFKS